MPYSEAQKKATMKYMKNAYDRVEFKVPKGKKAVIQEFAASQGESVNTLMNKLVNEAMNLSEETDSNIN